VPEEEVDRYKKADIRLHCPDVTGPVAIEIKRANKLPYSKLENALTGQLLGRYLKDIRSRHGILLLAHLGGKKSWRSKAKSGSMDFSSLVANLNDKAIQLAKHREDLTSLSVIGIDFTP